MIRYFRVQIANTLANVGTEGFIDPYDVWEYSNFDGSNSGVPGTNIPLTYAAGVMRGKAKARWNLAMIQLGSTRSPVHMSAITTDGDAGTMPTSIEFTIGYDVQDDSAIGATVPSDLYVWNESVAGVLTGQNAVKRMVARAMWNTYDDHLISLFDPRDNDNNPLAAVGTPYVGSTSIFVDLGALDSLVNVEGQITVTEIANIN